MEIVSKFPTVTTLMGGDLQATPTEGNERSYHAPLNQFCKATRLNHITPKDIHTYIPAKTSIDHWLLRHPNTTPHYTSINTKITTHTPVYGDHKVLILDLPQIGHITTPDPKQTQKNPTTRSHPPLPLPIPRNLIDLYQLGNPSTLANTQLISQTLNNLFTAPTVTADQLDYDAAQVMTITHEYHDIATHIWPLQTQKPDTPTAAQPKPPISSAGLRQISRLAKLRNECNKTTKLYPEASNDHERNPIHINEKINTLLNPAKPISTSEAHQQCNKAIGTIVRQASNTLNEKSRDKENESYEKCPKHYHNNLNISAGLLPRARDQSRVTTLRHPLTNTTHNAPQEVIDILTAHYTK